MPLTPAWPMGDAELGLVDFIVKERLFNFFLAKGCVPFTEVSTRTRP